MTQHPQTPSVSSFDDPEATTLSQQSAYDDSTSVTSASPTGVSTPVGPYSGSSAGMSGSSSGSSGSGGTSVRDEAASVTSDAAQSGRQVAGAAVSEAKDVVSEARSQVSTLLQQLRGEATQQASGQSDRAVQGLRSLADELRQMASSSSQQSGIATGLAGQAGDRVESVAGWLEQRQPGEVLDEVRDFARRRPGTFLASAAVLGVIGGRLTRGLTAGSSGSSGVDSRGELGLSAGPRYATAPVTSVGSDPTRVDAGIDPVTYTHPRPGVEGTQGYEGVEGVEGGQGLR